MERRNILKRIGAVSAATLAAGMASASESSNGDPQMQIYLPDQDETVTITDDCICDDCSSCYCPCDGCIC